MLRARIAAGWRLGQRSGITVNIAAPFTVSQGSSPG